MMKKGMIYNIQRYSLHDGPGIRTIIFLKGCPLTCKWCANPESQSFHTEKMGDEVFGYEIDVENVVKRALRDMPFFKRSGGGVTISGGEPLAQPEFTKSIIDRCRELGIHVAMETSSFTQFDVYKEVVENLDLLFTDIKHMNSDIHKKYTGVGNEQILYNIKNISKKNKDVIIRIPVIPTVNDSIDNLNKTIQFAYESQINEINLLPYHEFGVSKYCKLKRTYELSKIKSLSKDKLIELVKLVDNRHGINIKVI